MLCAAPPRADAAPNPIVLATNSRLRPNRSPIRPPASSRLPNASAYAVTTHSRPLSEKCSAFCAEGSAMLTTVMSSTIISCAIPRIAKIHQRRAPTASPPSRPRSRLRHVMLLLVRHSKLLPGCRRCVRCCTLRPRDASAPHTIGAVSAPGKQPSALGARPHPCRLRVQAAAGKPFRARTRGRSSGPCDDRSPGGHQPCARASFKETSEAHPGGHGRLADPGTVDRVPVTYVEWREIHGRGRRHLRTVVSRASR